MRELKERRDGDYSYMKRLESKNSKKAIPIEDSNRRKIRRRRSCDCPGKGKVCQKELKTKKRTAERLLKDGGNGL